MSKIRLIIIYLLFMFGLAAQAQVAFIPDVGAPFNFRINQPPAPWDNWYGNSVGEELTSFLDLEIYWDVASTHPWYNGTGSFADSVAATGLMAPSPVLYPLSQDNSYHNAVVYARALVSSNVIRGTNLELARVKNKKEGGDPLLGKGPGSMSFWQWLRLGQMSLQIYAKAAGIVRALHSGTVNINVWKLIPKIAVFNEDDPAAPALVMGLVPSSQGAIALATQITNFSDPRYYLGHLINYHDLDQLVPSLAVKPSFYGAYAHLINSSPADANQLLITKITQNFHELRTGLSMLKRAAMGHSQNENDIQRSRFSTAWTKNFCNDLQNQAGSWDRLYSELSTGSRYFGSNMASQVSAMGSSYTQIKNSEISSIQNALQVKAADTWKAKRLAGNITNVTAAYETQDYLAGAKQVETMIGKYATQDGNPGQYDDEKILVGLAVTDAWTNKLINDELRSLRTLYAMQVQREALEKMAPIIAQSQTEVNVASQRLARLQAYLQQLQSTQSADSRFFKAADLARVVTRMDSTPPVVTP